MIVQVRKMGFGTAKVVRNCWSLVYLKVELVGSTDGLNVVGSLGPEQLGASWCHWGSNTLRKKYGMKVGNQDLIFRHAPLERAFRSIGSCWISNCLNKTGVHWKGCSWKKILAVEKIGEQLFSLNTQTSWQVSSYWMNKSQGWKVQRRKYSQ